MFNLNVSFLKKIVSNLKDMKKQGHPQNRTRASKSLDSSLAALPTDPLTDDVAKVL